MTDDAKGNTLSDLSPLPIWVSWQLEPSEREGAPPAKVPYRATGRLGRDDRSGDGWGTLSQAQARATELPMPLRVGGVGVQIGQRVGDRLALVGIDLDTCRDKETGKLTNWAQEVVERLDTYGEISPSETGLKLFFLMREADRLAAIDHIRAAVGNGNGEGIKWARGNGAHPPAIELFLGKRFFTVTERALPNSTAELRVVDLETVGWLVNTAGPAFRGNGHARDGSRSGAAFRLAGNMKRAGKSFEDFCDAAQADPETAQWFREKGERQGGRELRRAWDHAKSEKQTQSEQTTAIATAAELFHTKEGDGFVDIEVSGHRETYPVRSKAFKQWLSVEFYRANGKTPSADAVEQAMTLTEGRARYESPEREVYLRVARVGDRVYLDLGDESWRAVEVVPDGWRVIDRPPVRFRRPAGMLPLPLPASGGGVNALKDFLNVDPDGFVMAVSWIVAALGGAGPYPIAEITGDHGSAKTSTGRYMRRVIDPNTVPSRSPPRSDRDLYVAAHNAHAIHFENISKLPDWLSDSLCRIATGGGFATRQLYENTDEILFRGMRPIILDGIENFIERADLADRAIKLALGEVTEEKRKTDAQLEAEFAEKHPEILGALLDAVSRGLAALPETKLDRLPRMVDFAVWITACEGALWPSGTFAKVYSANRDTMITDTIEGDLVADALMKFMNAKPWNYHFDAVAQPEPTDYWTGTATSLLTHLESGQDLKVTSSPVWPKNARALSAKLRRIRSSLRKIQINVTFFEDTKEIRIEPAAETAPPYSDVPF